MQIEPASLWRHCSSRRGNYRKGGVLNWGGNTRALHLFFIESPGTVTSAKVVTSIGDLNADLHCKVRTLNLNWEMSSSQKVECSYNFLNLNKNLSWSQRDFRGFQETEWRFVLDKLTHKVCCIYVGDLVSTQSCFTEFHCKNDLHWDSQK